MVSNIPTFEGDQNLNSPNRVRCRFHSFDQEEIEIAFPQCVSTEPQCPQWSQGDCNIKGQRGKKYTDNTNIN